MKVSKFSNNHIQIKFNTGVVMLQSYDSPVAIYDGIGCTYVNSSVYHYSRTTTKHVNKFLTSVNKEVMEISNGNFNEVMQKLCHD